ncbi:MAG: DNA/RNA nuclease SfsA [Proteobacteria bacterium]|nr:DNA/RNA nuclease SfsA [Pseudomonadota bacterium]MDA1357219.1 DNA/RNA nuclease SfsA [Pseudomonadota bacterium]
MQFPDPLLRGTLIKRYKRFLSDHRLEDGSTVTAHCANPGAMLGLTAPGAETWLSPARNPERKLRHTWELIRVAPGRRGLVGINTSLPNSIVAEAIAAGRVSELDGYDGIRREVKYGKNSRIDLLLERDGAPPCYVEVKNVHLRRRAKLAEFPDSVTARGTKHLRELAAVVEAGGRAVMFYLVQRADCESFALAGDIDPEYAAAFEAASKSGVEALCFDCELDGREIRTARQLPLILPD